MRRTLVVLTLALTATATAANLTYLGPKGTYSDEAARLVAQSGNWTTSTATSITEVAQAVAAGQTDYGLLPIENSSGGYVVETLGLLKTGLPKWRIIGEIALPINNVLMAKPGTTLADVTTIVSHPQPFLQSAGYLKANYPNVKRVEAKSTAAAAEDVSKMPGNAAAAIAAPAAASVYGLVPLASAIQDDKRNTTKFWVVQAGELPRTGAVNRAVVIHDLTRNTPTLSLLITRMSALGFQVSSLTQSPSGELGGARYVLVFDGSRGADMAGVRQALTPGSTLLGAYTAP